MVDSDPYALRFDMRHAVQAREIADAINVALDAEPAGSSWTACAALMRAA